MTAGTALHGSHLPLRHWVYAIFLVAQRKCSISAMQLQRDLCIGYTAAWFMLQRIRRFLAERPLSRLHRGHVEISAVRLNDIDARSHPHTEDACPTSDINKIVIGIERRTRAGLPRLRFGRLRALAIPASMPMSTLVELHVAKSARVSVLPKPIGRVILKNFSDCLRGTFHGVSRKHLPAYLQEHVFRFNRRRRLDLLPSFVGRRLACGGPLQRAALRTTPPGVDLPVRTAEPVEAIEPVDIQAPPVRKAPRETQAPPEVPERELTPEEILNAELDRLLSGIEGPRKPGEDARALAKRLLGSK